MIQSPADSWSSSDSFDLYFACAVQRWVTGKVPVWGTPTHFEALCVQIFETISSVSVFRSSILSDSVPRYIKRHTTGKLILSPFQWAIIRDNRRRDNGVTTIWTVMYMHCTSMRFYLTHICGIRKSGYDVLTHMCGISPERVKRHWMRVPAAYKQTKNQINATTHITAGSCYREVRWKWHVGTNGQKATISHLSARSKLKNWPSPPWSCCLAGNRAVNQEKIPHFNKQLAQGCSKQISNYVEVLGLFARDSSFCD